MTLQEGSGAQTVQSVGPVKLQFQVVGHSATGLLIQFLKVEDSGRFPDLQKWTRLRCEAGAYVAKAW